MVGKTLIRGILEYCRPGYFSLMSVRQTSHLEYGSPGIMGGKSRKSGGMW